MKHFCSFFLAILTVLFISQTSIAQTPGDYAYDLAFDAEMNRYLLVYAHIPPIGSEVYGQFIDVAGNPIGDEIVLSDDGPEEQGSAKVAFDPEKRLYLVVWRDWRNAGVEIWGQFIYQDGTLKGENFQIQQNSNTPYDLEMERDSVNGRYMLVWYEPNGGNADDVFAKLLDDSGSTIKDAFVISNLSGNQRRPDLAFDDSNEKYFVVWEESDAPTDINGKFVDKDGTVDSMVTIVSNATGDQERPKVAFAPEVQRYLVVFQDFRNGNYDIFSQAITAEGGAQGTDKDSNQLLCDDAYNQTGPILTKGSNSLDYLVGWLDTRILAKISKMAPANYNLFGQYVGDGGAPSGENIELVNDPVTQRNLLIGYNPNCSNFLITYTSEETSPEYLYIMGHLIEGAACSASPDAPILKSPENGATGVSTSPTFDWDPSEDSDGDDVNYSILICDDEHFEDCSSTAVASLTKTEDGYALAGLALWMLLCPAGFFILRKKKRGLIASALITLLIFTAFLSLKCSSSSTTGDDTSFTADGLKSNTKYYWRVSANDGKGGIGTSETWSFTTE